VPEHQGGTATGGRGRIVTTDGGEATSDTVAAPSAGESGRRRPGPLGANYWKLFASATMTNLGDGLMSVAVLWLASAITRDPTSIALVGLASRLPWLVFSLPAGVITDRYDRRVLVASMDVARVVLIAAFAVVVLVHQDGLP